MSEKLNPLEVIAAIRIGIKDANYRFKNGGCFQLHRILKELFPDAEAWYDAKQAHVYTRIHDAFYDIDGEVAFRDEFYQLMTDPILYAKAHEWDFQQKVG